MVEKKKVLFVVYRTEWWGCLDSFCRQECEAEDTVCYVMPVPRYERDDITFKVNFSKVHFYPEELEPELPEGACLVDWQEFSLEQGFERIYIHNPYDNNSLTDSVELKYYSANLKPYAKKLIYVPHLMDLIPADYMNGHVYDYVDAIYVPKESSRFLLDVKYDEKVEVVPSGIPAYLDRLANRREEERRKKDGRNPQAGKPGRDARKADGRMKLLYCVSYNDLYQGTEKQLAKMREIFDYAAKNQDIQLIFRPDEEIRAKRQLLDEKIWKEYERLMARFRASGTGIYDESLNLYEAAVNADGIMSRNHPMNALFSVQGKYVLQVDFVQRQAPPSREERCTPAVWDAAVTERDGEIELLFVPGGTRLICRMVISGVADSVDGRQTSGGKNAKAIAQSVRKKGKKHLSGPKVEVLAEVPDECINEINYMYVQRLENCLYLIPGSSDGIWKYDMNMQYFSKAYLPDNWGWPISAAFSYGRYLYMAPSSCPGIIRYDTETEEITVIDGWVREMESLVSVEYRKEPYFYWAAVQEGHMLYMASSQGDIWMEFDMEKDSWQLRPMNLPDMRFVHMVKDGDWVWLLPYSGDEIVVWNCRLGAGQVVYNSENANREGGLAPYLFALDLGDTVAAFPQRETDHVLLIPKGVGTVIPQGETNGDEVRKLSRGIPCSPLDCRSEYRKRVGYGYEFVKRLESGLILAYEYYGGSFLLLDGKLNMIRRIPCRLEIETVRQQQDEIWRSVQARYGYAGRISESGSIPVMLESFVRHGWEDREKIREYYRRYYGMF